MICELHTAYNQRTKTTNTIILPLSHTGDELYDMLNAAFPYNHETYQGVFWNFFPCCFGGYDNAVEFLF